MSIRLESHSFGETADGERAGLYRISNDAGMEVAVTNYGATVVAICIPDRDGASADVVLGFDSLSEYEAHREYYGAAVGRFANRIAGGSFVLNAKTYNLNCNEGANHLHGGIRGFDKAIWHCESDNTHGNASIKLTYVSPSGEEGYPGNLVVDVIYSLTDANEFSIAYTATTDEPTVVNLSHHSYFNLAGEGSGNVLNHELMIDADYFTPVDRKLIPTGELKSVSGSALDFTRTTRIGERIDNEEEQLVLCGGYDHNYVLKGKPGELKLAARVFEPNSGRTMELHTTAPGLQFYSGNMMGECARGKDGHEYRPRGGFCLEPQHFPNSPNQPNFPSTVLNPGDEYRQKSIFKFYV